MRRKARSWKKWLLSTGMPIWAIVLISCFLFFAVLGDFIANEKPLYCKIDGQSYSPVLIDYGVRMGVARWPEPLLNIDWRKENYEAVIRTIIPYGAKSLDFQNANFKGPFSEQNVASLRFRHWLGTDALGRDVLAGMIRGCRIALFIGIFSMLLAATIGIPLGALIGYYGDTRRLRLDKLVMFTITGVFLLYFLFELTGLLISGYFANIGYPIILLVLSLLIFILSKYLLDKVQFRLPEVRLPLDFIVMRTIEVFRSIPAFFLLFALLGLIDQPSLWYVVGFIALMRWPTVARYVRAESLKIREQNYILSARVVGLRDGQIIRRHVIPNALGPVFVTLAFGMGGAVLLESGLSFLGIGLGVEEVSWGKMLNEARKNFSAWWLALFPGTAIFLLIAAFQAIGDSLQKKYQPQLGVN